jgi:ubiquinone/menaquinone biosynthesis C-methylase UbiE
MDKALEFAPGLGFNVSIALKNNQKNYTGVELNEEVAQILRKNIHGEDRKIIIGNASKSTLPNSLSDKVYGEVMLTMQADHKKSEIIKEASRILKKGGLYGIHKLGLTPNELEKTTTAKIQRELAEEIKVNARPLTETELKIYWKKRALKLLKYIKTPCIC